MVSEPRGWVPRAIFVPNRRSESAQNHHIAKEARKEDDKETVQFEHVDIKQTDVAETALGHQADAEFHRGSDPRDHGQDRQHPVHECNHARRAQEVHVDGIAQLQGRHHLRQAGGRRPIHRHEERGVTIESTRASLSFEHDSDDGADSLGSR